MSERRFGDRLNPANALTATRYISLPLFLNFVEQGKMQFAVLSILYCAFADVFDGMIARACNCTSSFGEFFDAITDAVCYGFFLAVVVGYGLMPREAMAAIVVMGIANAVMRVIYAKRAGRATNYRSYAMERFVAFAAVLSCFAVVGWEIRFFSWSAVGCMAVIMLWDTKRMLLDPIDPEGVTAK